MIFIALFILYHGQTRFELQPHRENKITHNSLVATCTRPASDVIGWLMSTLLTKR